MPSFLYKFFWFLILFSFGFNQLSALDNGSDSIKMNYKIEKIKYLNYYNTKTTDEALLYNLAYVSYYKKSFIDALYYFEKAKLIDPFNEDINHNIKLVREQVQGSDKIKEHFFSQTFRYVLSLYSEIEWFLWALFFLIFSVFVYALSKFHKPLKIYRLVYFLTFFHFLVALIFLSEKKSAYLLPQYAIVFSSKIDVYDSPSPQGKIMAQLTEGDKVEVLDESNNYYLIKQNDKKLFVWKGALKIL